MPWITARRPGEVIKIGNDIEVVVLEVHGQRVRIAVKAPKAVLIKNKPKPYSTAEMFNKEAKDAPSKPPEDYDDYEDPDPDLQV